MGRLKSNTYICATANSILNRKCQAILQGHTSLVGQLQMRGNTLVTGGSDGSVRVWSLTTNLPIHRLAAHDNSVTSLQFDDARIVSGGSDGRVKIWDTNTGALIRELSQPAEAVWRVAFESERCVVMASRTGRTIMEVWDFAPPADSEGEVHGEFGMMESQDGDLDMVDAEDDRLGKDTMLEVYGTGGSEEDSEDMTD
ncbi:hypothetical protein P7C71_g3299, partial [Lecanoromycetidae sp. Uapishka_2]